MPWCPGCDRFLSPATVTPSGDCPRCGAPVDPGRARAAAPDPTLEPAKGEPALAGSPAPAPGEAAAVDDFGSEDEGDTLPLPWHFKLLVGAIALYLGWRAVQGVEWVVHRF